MEDFFTPLKKTFWDLSYCKAWCSYLTFWQSTEVEIWQVAKWCGTLIPNTQILPLGDAVGSQGVPKI